MNIRIIKTMPDIDVAMEIAASGFVQPESEALREDVAIHLKEGQIVYTIEVDGVLSGFAIFNDISPVLYLSGIILNERCQGKGITKKVVEVARVQTGASILALRTQSTHMYMAGKHVVAPECWFPHATIEISASLLSVREGLVKKLGMTSAIHQGFYGGPLYGEKPIHGDARVQAYFDSICNFDRGDAVLCIGYF